MCRWLALLGIAALAGCVATPGPVKDASDVLPRPGAKVSLGSVTNTSGSNEFQGDAAAMLQNALARALREETLQAAQDPGDFTLSLKITDYRPGNAFKRWLIPGWGSTVLAIKGELKDARDGRLAASIDHERSIAAGGVFSIGGWSRIFDWVADDIARDLKVRIDQGGGFVVSLPAWADRAAVQAPPAMPRTARIVAITDLRAQAGRIGERFAAFGVSMGDVHFSRRVPDFMGESLNSELSALGYRMVASGEDVSVTAEIEKFWVTTDTSPLYWDVIGEIQMKLSVQTAAAKLPPTERSYSCRSTDRTYVWPSSALLGNVLGQCLADLMGKMHSDPVWAAPPI